MLGLEFILLLGFRLLLSLDLMHGVGSLLGCCSHACSFLTGTLPLLQHCCCLCLRLLLCLFMNLRIQSDCLTKHSARQRPETSVAFGITVTVLHPEEPRYMFLFLKDEKPDACPQTFLISMSLLNGRFSKTKK